MVVDDDNDYLESVKAILEANGYAVIAANNAQEGLKSVESEHPQLIIIDLMMKAVNEGYDFCLRVGHDKRFEEIPMIMISSAHQNEIFRDVNFTPDVFWFPIDDFLDKPIDQKAIDDIMSDFLHYQEAQGGGSIAF